MFRILHFEQKGDDKEEKEEEALNEVEKINLERELEVDFSELVWVEILVAEV